MNHGKIGSNGFTGFETFVSPLVRTLGVLSIENGFWLERLTRFFDIRQCQCNTDVTSIFCRIRNRR